MALPGSVAQGGGQACRGEIEIIIVIIIIFITTSPLYLSMLIMTRVRTETLTDRLETKGQN